MDYDVLYCLKCDRKVETRKKVRGSHTEWWCERCGSLVDVMDDDDFDTPVQGDDE